MIGFTPLRRSYWARYKSLIEIAKGERGKEKSSSRMGIVAHQSRLSRLRKWKKRVQCYKRGQLVLISYLEAALPLIMHTKSGVP